MSVMRCPQCERIVDTDLEPGEEIGNMRRLMIWVCTPCAEEYHEGLEAQQDAASRGEP